MASAIIGRTACPECGEKNAQVKKSERCVYRYCPECGAQYHAKGTRQTEALMAKTRLDAATKPAPAGPEPRPEPAPASSAAPAPEPAATKPRRLSLFGA